MVQVFAPVTENCRKLGVPFSTLIYLFSILAWFFHAGHVRETACARSGAQLVHVSSPCLGAEGGRPRTRALVRAALFILAAKGLWEKERHTHTLTSGRSVSPSGEFSCCAGEHWKEGLPLCLSLLRISSSNGNEDLQMEQGKSQVLTALRVCRYLGNGHPRPADCNNCRIEAGKQETSLSFPFSTTNLFTHTKREGKVDKSNHQEKDAFVSLCGTACSSGTAGTNQPTLYCNIWMKQNAFP
jgi:hypothetical protein